MKKTKRHEKINPYDPYEDFVKLDKLDAYEAQIKSNFRKSYKQFVNREYPTNIYFGNF